MKDSGTFKEIFRSDHANSEEDPVQSLAASPDLLHLSEVAERNAHLILILRQTSILNYTQKKRSEAI